MEQARARHLSTLGLTLLCSVRCRLRLAYAALAPARPRRLALGLRRHYDARMCCLLIQSQMLAAMGDLATLL